MRLRPSTQRNSQSASSSAEVRPLGPHAPTFLALVVEERRSVVPHVEAHPPHRSVAFRARCRLPHPDALPNPCSARRHSLSSSREEIERGAPVADALGNVDDRRCSLDGAIGPGRGLQHYQASCRLMCKDPAVPRTLVQRANGGADVRRLPPRASSQPTTSFGLLLWRALCVMK